MRIVCAQIDKETVVHDQTLKFGFAEPAVVPELLRCHAIDRSFGLHGFEPLETVGGKTAPRIPL